MSTATATTATATATKAFTSAALTAELGRRRNNKTRDIKVRPKSFVFPKLTAADIKAIQAGELVTVTFGTGRVEVVGLKA